LQAQQAQLDQLKQQVSALQNQHASASYSTAAPGGCDPAVMAAATRKGGARMAAGDASQALGYYQDAVTACPTSAQAQLNLANTYETIGDRAAAVQHYRLAAGANGSGADAAATQKARQALTRMGAS
jgi:Tfp pilus assembly protein PilF